MVVIFWQNLYLHVYLQTQKVKIPQFVPYTGFGWLCDIVALATKQKCARKYPDSEDAQKISCQKSFTGL